MKTLVTQQTQQNWLRYQSVYLEITGLYEIFLSKLPPRETLVQETFVVVVTVWTFYFFPMILGRFKDN